MNARRAFTLLEVILALAILAGSLAVLGEAVRGGMRNAAAARDEAKAQLLAASKLAEIISGFAPPAAASDTPLESDPAWLYTVNVNPGDQPGILAVAVTLRRNQPAEQSPTTFTLVRWMRDPSMITTQPAGSNPASPSSPSSSSSSATQPTGGGAGQ